MSKIWFFGDSYISSYKLAKSWTINVQEEFIDYDSENLGLPGSSLDYLYYIYNKRRTEIKEGDIVILTLTTYHRLFLKHEIPGKNSFLFPDFIHTQGEGHEWINEGHEYYGHFVSDLFNLPVHEALKNVFLNSLQYDAITKGIKIIVLPVDKCKISEKDSITTVNNTRHGLLGVSGEQHQAKFGIGISHEWFKHEKFREYDKSLANHLTPRNNEILANKVIRNIKTNEPIDLATEWEYT
jgi:hypothetical protein